MMDAQILKWTLTILWSLGIIINIACIGQDKGEYTKAGAIASAIINGAFITWIQTSL